METHLTLKYQGPEVDAGRMDVYQASANMIAFSEFMVAAAKATFGTQVEARAEVAGFGHSSFLTHLVFDVVGPAATLLSALSPREILEVVSESVKLWKHLKGLPPRTVQHANHQDVRVTNNNGQVIQVQSATFNLVLDEKGGEAVAKFIQEPLSRMGIDRLKIETPAGKSLATVDKHEAAYFRPVTPSEQVTDHTTPIALIIEAPVFKEGNKWRFSDGQTSFHADILDLAFLARVDSGERFGKGDVLFADVRLTQQRTGNKLTTDRAVVKVHDHRPGQVQMSILPPDDTAE